MLRQMSRASVTAAALALALGAGLGGAACSDERLEELEAVRKQVCACKTAACGEEAMKRVPQGDVRSDHYAQRIAKKMMECLARLYLEERPQADPDAEEPAPAPDRAGAAAKP
jgi:hypothetical protein